ncbi:CRISPR-associated endonuclease Cas1 [Methylicorpusculum oleiharenae]|uniref:CRISPR-associated endonuclease Cas1 n=1 Tax=Methylicorpusculum oleiharenae TaxID=1338687 RepID=UPI00135825E4|nr:CRISPR-associated endonuclease Cas1 [Methylicorpusculum oleiharenae]MCD2452419.1 CRISPR-associated endonuclease Cas1 [Methylicorpusculum oleiharenae]
MRPLYIDGSPGCRVVLDDPALRVMVPDKADQLFPLSRISRVVCNGVVDWSMSALLACADAGVYLIFLEKNGEVRARWLGRGSTRQSLTQRLVDLLARADGLQRYENWYLSMEKLAARSFARRMGIKDWREVSINDLQRQLTLSLSDEGRYKANLLQGLLHSELLNWLPECGFSHDDDALLSGELDLAKDLSKLLLWDCYPSLLSGSEGNNTKALGAVAILFEQRTDRFYLLFRSTISKLHQFLLSVC